MYTNYINPNIHVCNFNMLVYLTFKAITFYINNRQRKNMNLIYNK